MCILCFFFTITVLIFKYDLSVVGGVAAVSFHLPFDTSLVISSNSYSSSSYSSFQIIPHHREHRTGKDGRALLALITSVRTARSQPINQYLIRENNFLLFVGAILVIGATVCFLYSLVEGGNAHPWRSAIIIAVRDGSYSDICPASLNRFFFSCNLALHNIRHSVNPVSNVVALPRQRSSITHPSTQKLEPHRCLLV